MTEKPKISIIIPVYKTRDFLARCLDSVLNQTFSDWQAVCINDGSPDDSDKILAEYAARDGRFKIITQKNAGLSQARNVGIAAADGEFVLLLDSDDFLHHQTLEILNYVVTHNNVDMVSFGYDARFHSKLSKMLARGRDIFGILPPGRTKKYNPSKIGCFVTDNILAHSTERNHTLFSFYPVRRHCFPVLAMYRRELIADLSFIRGIIMEDFPWWCAVMLRRPRTAMIQTPLYFYMPNPTSILNSSHARRMIESIIVGLENVFCMAKKCATDWEFRRLRTEFLWPFSITAMRKVRDLDNNEDVRAVRQGMKKLYDMGVFDVAPSRRARRYRKRIRDFIADK